MNSQTGSQLTNDYLTFHNTLLVHFRNRTFTDGTDNLNMTLLARTIDKTQELVQFHWQNVGYHTSWQRYFAKALYDQLVYRLYQGDDDPSLCSTASTEITITPKIICSTWTTISERSCIQEQTDCLWGWGPVSQMGVLRDIVEDIFVEKRPIHTLQKSHKETFQLPVQVQIYFMNNSLLFQNLCSRCRDEIYVVFIWTCHISYSCVTATV